MDTVSKASPRGSMIYVILVTLNEGCMYIILKPSEMHPLHPEVSVV